MKHFTIVYMDAMRKPKETYRFELEAVDSLAALAAFINHPLFRDQQVFVACIVEGPRSTVHQTR